MISRALAPSSGLEFSGLRPATVSLVMGLHVAMLWFSMPQGQAIGTPEPVIVVLERDAEPHITERAEPAPVEPLPPMEAAAAQPDIPVTMSIPEPEPVVVVPPPVHRVEPTIKRQEPKPIKQASRPPSSAMTTRASPTTAAPGAGGNNTAYAARVRATLQAQANALGFEEVNATVGLAFTINEAGRVVSSSITKPSGDFKVDGALRRMLSALSFPPPPAGQFSGTVTIRIF